VTFPLISPDWDFALWAVLIGIAGFGFWADSTGIGKRVSGVGIMLVAAMILGNFGVIPHVAPAYDVVWGFLVPTAVPLLLLKANLRRIIPETGPMLGAYFLAVVGTLSGAVLGLVVLPMGEAGPDLAGILSATYIGGSMNFAAVAEALEFNESTLLTAALAADNVVGTLHILVVVLIPSVLLLRKWIPSPIVETSVAPAHGEAGTEDVILPFQAGTYLPGIDDQPRNRGHRLRHRGSTEYPQLWYPVYHRYHPAGSQPVSSSTRESAGCVRNRSADDVYIFCDHRCRRRCCGHA